MPLGVIPMILFWVLGIFGEKSQKEQERKSGKKRAPMPQRGVPSPRRGRGTKMAPPWVRYGVALLCRGVDTIHSKQIFGFCSESLVFIHRLFRNLNK